jgi:dolichyl-phosphate beta-glucosyltransferase
MTHRQPYLSIVLPAYNEQDRLPATLDAWMAYLSEQHYIWEIVISDDGSSDRTSSVAMVRAVSDPRIIVVKAPENQGKGAAVRRGIVAARGEVVLFSDADLAVPPHFTADALAVVEAGADLAVGQRSLREYARTERSIGRLLAGAAVQVGRRVLGLTFVADSQCGFKALRREAALDIVRRATVNGFAFDIELLFLARRIGATVVPFPVDVDFRSGSTFDVAKHLPSLLRDIVRIRLNALRGRYAVGINP